MAQKSLTAGRDIFPKKPKFTMELEKALSHPFKKRKYA